MPSHTSATGGIAPGAEAVGHAQIITELGKPFELAGLFAGADAGAFGDIPDAEMDAETQGADPVVEEMADVREE
jgi:nuclear GTP-binding protein